MESLPHNFSTRNLELDAKLTQYLSWDKNSTTRDEILNLAKGGKFDELKGALLTRLEFGTAGIRGKMCGGFGNMNDLVLIQTSQGLATYIEKYVQTKNITSPLSVVIGYDGRHNSKRFAELTARAMSSKKMKPFLFSHLVPTPFIPFTVQYYNTKKSTGSLLICGIMITASHNPKEDNGYKVYWENGAQIISPHDKGIQSCILENLEPWENAWSIENISQICIDPLGEINEAYFSSIKVDESDEKINSETKLRFVYTPMHGVGEIYMKEAFKACKFHPFISVENQKDPDPEFPTVKFPNPEEGKSALNSAISTANAANSTIILANDPDADRLAVAEKTNNGDWKIFNGNELGALLGWWTIETFKKSFQAQNKTASQESLKEALSDCYLISSTVSSKILQTFADKEGLNFIETLTGFKWMGNIAFDLFPAKKVLFAFEEAIGFMVGNIVYDKDGINAGVKLAGLAAYLSKNNLTLNDQLNWIYDFYGYHVSENSYYICRDPEIIRQIFDRIRELDKTGTELLKYPKGILGGKYKICSVRDLTVGYDSSQADFKPILPISKSSQMITFNFTNGLTATLRTSGTEPKIKYYTELRASPAEKDRKKVEETLHEMVQGIIEELLEPTKYNLEPKSD